MAAGTVQKAKSMSRGIIPSSHLHSSHCKHWLRDPKAMGLSSGTPVTTVYEHNPSQTVLELRNERTA